MKGAEQGFACSLHLAVLSPHPPHPPLLLQMLLNGHNVNGMDYDNRTALMVAACKVRVGRLKRGTRDKINYHPSKFGSPPPVTSGYGSTLYSHVYPLVRAMALWPLCFWTPGPTPT